jgi:hypothetical protein
MELIPRLDDWFAQQLENLKCSDAVRAYTIGVLTKLPHDMSDESIVLAFQSASQNSSFEKFQKIGDWTLWSLTFAPHPVDSQRALIEYVGKQSYYSCHRILRGQWILYEELANGLTTIVSDVKQNIFSQNKTLK